MKTQLSKRLLSLLLVVTLLAGFALPVQATDTQSGGTLSFEKVENGDISSSLINHAEELTEEAPYADTDAVRVSIVLDQSSTLEKGFSTLGIADNAQAMAYRDSLKEAQVDVTAAIETAIAGELDVRWNLTLAANIISANVQYGQIDEIAAVRGVKEVVLETRYEPAVYSVDENNPNMATSGEQIGSAAAWANGYTGLGSRVAIIDTGIDTDHQSFSAKAYQYTLAYQAGRHGMEIDEYAASLNLLDAEEIASLADQLNVPAQFTGENLYINSKIPFGYNYIDEDLDVTHDNDSQGSHGSHVAGIAAANMYIPESDGTFSRALESVYVQGVAPDAQILAMKVFGKNGGAYDSDYFAAVEDAIVLGCDSVNLSLGSVSPGYTTNATYQQLLDSLTDSDIVMVTSAGNNGSWADNVLNGVPYLYADDVNMHTGGAPGSYTNTLAVASVDNNGSTGYYIQSGDELIFYTAGANTDADHMSTIAGEQGYIFLDSIGTQMEWSVLADVLEGKIAVCSRGTTSFYQKANAAVENGAIATLIYNNTAGTINMDMSSYSYTAPVASITQQEGAILKANATAVTDEAGNVLYYEGKLTVSEGLGTVVYDSDYYTMSSFSSWGVAGSLILKPEITAPGGSIYSVNGVDTSGTAYETMSGTSMAAPQVTGMAALVGQYIRENGLTEKTGLSERQLAQSLLMSTATPLRDGESGGNYWSVLQQGSGLANVGAAVSAQSYILMDENATDSWADGKVKAELGDDPQRTGAYTFSFTIHNMSDAAKGYTLSADIFTQDLFQYGEEIYMDTWTAALGANVTYTVDGETFVPVSKVDCDLDADGDTDADDAQIILNHTSGLTAEIDTIADVDGDGAVTTYDAYLILDSLETRAITVAPGQQAQVTVQIVFPEALKELLNASYEDGAYVEGYVYVKPVTTAEGEIVDVTHSIPVLGFYGSWSEPSMYEKASYTEYLYGETTAPYLNNTQTNNLVIKYEDSNSLYWQIGNPYFIEAEYPAGRSAISQNSTLVQYRYTMLRSAGAVAWMVTDDDGEILYLSNPYGQTLGAWYYTNGAAWQNTVAALSMGRKVSSLGVSEGDTIHVSMVAVPEYYTGDGLTKAELTELINSGTLGEGAFLTTTMVIDSTAPEIDDITESKITGNMIITAQDNEYVAAVLVTNKSGTVTYAAAQPEQTEKNEMVRVELDLSEAGIGKECLVQVADYAGNVSSYYLYYDGDTDAYDGKMYGFTDLTRSSKFTAANQWLEIDPENVSFYYSPSWTRITRSTRLGTTAMTETDLKITAAEYVDGWVYMAADDGNLYVAEQGLWNDYNYVNAWSGTVSEIRDLSYNYADGKLYALASTGTDENAIYTVDVSTGVLTPAFTLTIQLPEGKTGKTELANLAIDRNGGFWSINDENGHNGGMFVVASTATGNTTASYLFHWTDADVADGTVTGLAPVNNTADGNVATSGWIGTMAWDHDTNVLYMAGTRELGTHNSSAYLYTVDTAAGTIAKVSQTAGGMGAKYASLLGVPLTGMYIVPSGDVTGVGPTDKAYKVELDRSEITVAVGTTFRLTETVYPWNLTDKTVTWTSSDASVAVVSDKGVVTTTGIGTATITATTNASPYMTASCTVTSEPLEEVALTGVVYESGTAYWGDITTTALPAWEKLEPSAHGYLGGALSRGKVYAHDGSNLYAIDPETFEAEQLGAIVSMWQWSDAAALSEDVYPQQSLLTISNSGTYLVVLAPESGSLMYYDLTSVFSADPMAAIANVTQDGQTTADYYMMTEGGDLYYIELVYGSMTRYLLGNTGLSLGGVASVGSGSFASMHYDEATGYVMLATNANTGSNTLYAIDPDAMTVTNTGSLGGDVSAVAMLYQYDRIKELTVLVSPTEKRVFAGDSLQLTSRVLPKQYSAQVTWTSSDTAVATVDENGLVTAVAPGTAVITATTVDVNDAGQPAAAQVAITVPEPVDVDLSFNAQVATDDGTSWATIDTSDLTGCTTIASSQTAFTGAGVHDGKIIANTADFVNPSDYYQVDPATGAQTLVSQLAVANTILDGTTLPANRNYTGNFIYMDEGQNLSIMEDQTTGLGNHFNMAQGGFTDLGAIAYGGALEDDRVPQPGQALMPGDPMSRYYILGGDGTLYFFRLTNYSNLMFPMKVEQQAAIDLGYTFADHRALSMTFINDGTNTGLVIADSSGEETVLFWIDLTAETIVLDKIGTLPGAKSVVGLYTEGELSGTVTGGGYDPSSASAGAETLSAPMSAAVSAEPIYLSSGDSANQVGGSTNAVTTAIARERPAIELSAAQAEPGDDALTLTITETEDVTNGIVQVTYDPAVLCYQDTASAAQRSAVSVDEAAGTITISYATASPVTAGSAIASVRFGYVQDMVETTLEVETLERNRQQNLSQSVTVDITYEVGGHSYQITETHEPSCTEDGYSVWTCTKCGDSYQEPIAATGHDHQIAETQAPSCTEDGYNTWTCANCGDSYQEPIAATGHSYGPWTTVTEATCFADGLEARTCEACGDTETRPIAANSDNCPSDDYSDLSADAWYHEAVDFVLDSGLMIGLTEDQFVPGGTVNRAQLMVILYRLEGSPAVETEAPFTDVEPGSWYADAVAWAAENGIANGVSDVLFAPGSDVTREQTVTFLARYAALKGVETTSSGDLSGYTDAGSVSDYAYGAMAWAVETGLIQGVTEDTLEPQSTTNRAQLATILMRYCGMFR